VVIPPWIALKVTGIPFAETVIPIYYPGSREKFLALSAGRQGSDPSGRRCDGMGIARHPEYVAETISDAGLWPRDAAARAHARAIASEMHAGFVPLRRQCPMTCGVRSRSLS